MNNYDENANNAADRHARLMHESLNESVPHRSDRPLETKAIINQQRLDKIRYTLNGIAIAIVMLAIYMIWSK